jgi:hypothetical protein
LEGSAVSDGVLEVPAVLKGVAHVLVVRALGVEDVVQRAFVSAEVLPGCERWVVRRHALLREASSPNVCRVAGSRRVVAPSVRASLLR